MLQLSKFFLYYQSFIYSPTDGLVSCLKKKTVLKFTLKQLWHVLVQLHHHQGAHYSCWLKVQLLKLSIAIRFQTFYTLSVYYYYYFVLLSIKKTWRKICLWHSFRQFIVSYEKDIKFRHVLNTLTFILLMWRIGWAPNNASK